MSSFEIWMYWLVKEDNKGWGGKKVRDKWVTQKKTYIVEFISVLCSSCVDNTFAVAFVAKVAALVFEVVFGLLFNV